MLKYIEGFFRATGIHNFVVLLVEGPGSIFGYFSILNIVLLNIFFENEINADESTIKVFYSLGLLLTYCVVYTQTFIFFKSRFGIVNSKVENLESQMEDIRSLSDRISKLQMKFTERSLTVLFIIDAFVIVFYGNSVMLEIIALFVLSIIGQFENI